jgi:hypothetical protein
MLARLSEDIPVFGLPSPKLPDGVTGTYVDLLVEEGLVDAFPSLQALVMGYPQSQHIISMLWMLTAAG